MVRCINDFLVFVDERFSRTMSIRNNRRELVTSNTSIMRYKLKDTVFPQNTSNVFFDVDNATLPFTKFQSKVKNYHNLTRLKISEGQCYEFDSQNLLFFTLPLISDL